MKTSILLFFLITFISCNNGKNNSKEIKSEKETSVETTSETEKMPAKDSQIIVPGKNWGKIALNEDASKLLDSLGKADSGDAAMGKAVMSWNNYKGALLTLYTTRQMGVEDFSRIKVIRSLSSEFKTEDNLGVNSTLADLKRYYKLDYAGKFAFNGKHYILYSTNKGIGFEVGMDQKCNGVLIYPVTSEPTSTYLPIYADFDFHGK